MDETTLQSWERSFWHGFARIRELEGTLDQPVNYGAWAISAMRAGTLWGIPSAEVVPVSFQGRPWPPPTTPPDLAASAFAHRYSEYHRVRSAEECAWVLDRGSAVNACFTLTSEWEAPEGGVVRHRPEAKPLPVAHGVMITGIETPGLTGGSRLLHFENYYWGVGWANGGMGWMDPYYFDAHLIEAFVWRSDKLPRSNHSHVGIVSEPMGLNARSQQMLYIHEQDDSVRYGWATITEEEYKVRVDDLFVPPEFRQRGYGRQLWNMLLEFSTSVHKPLHLYVPFADCDPSRLEFLRGFFGRRGYRLKRSSVRWAGCEVVPGRMRANTPTVDFPPRPAAALDLFAGVLAAAMSLAGDVPRSGLTAPGALPPATVARADGNERLQSTEKVEHVTVLGRLDVRARLEELKMLKQGWLDGKGYPLSAVGLAWLADAFETWYPSDLPLPYLFPTPEGRVLAEWPRNPWSLSLEIDLATKTGAWHALNLDTDAEESDKLDLTSSNGWLLLGQLIRNLVGGGE